MSSLKLTIVLFGAVILSGCNKTTEPPPPPLSGPLRVALVRDCMAHLPAGPVATQYNDWDEVVAQCDNTAWYLMNQCKGNEAGCLAQLQPKELILSHRAEQTICTH